MFPRPLRKPLNITSPTPRNTKGGTSSLLRSPKSNNLAAFFGVAPNSDTNFEVITTPTLAPTSPTKKG